jgi:hypothetical protein
VAERAEELRGQLDMQRADISRTVEQIENRVSPSRVLSRRKYRMRRSFTDLKDRLMGNDEPDYPSNWYAQPAAPLGPQYAGGTQYTYGGYDQQDGGRFDDARQRAGQVTGRASGAMHEAGDRASETMHDVGQRASGAMHDVGDRVQDAPQALRRQTQGSPLALGLLAFGAGVVAAALLPESEKERQLARQAEPQLQQAVAGAKELGTDMVHDLREPVEESVEQVKGTAATEAQAFKEEATQEAQATRSDVESRVKE